MQALILAAGMGKRLGKHTEENTKCMVHIDGRSLIDHALSAIKAAGISRVVIVAGYRKENLKRHVAELDTGLDIVYVDNDLYDRTNNIYSLWMAEKHLTEDDTILLESDIIFDESIIRDLIMDPYPDMAVVAKFEHWMDGTVALLDEENRIVNFIPKKYFRWGDIGSYYKTVNIYKFSKRFAETCYIPFLEAYLSAFGENEYYEQVLRVLTYLENMNLKAHIVTGKKWYEIDDVQDLDIASALFAGTSEKLPAFQKRYGGYWRFPELRDFCYLVNPYFPTPELRDEMISLFDKLIGQYPSGLAVQNLLASKAFGCEPSQIVVGNGAAELIRYLADSIEAQVGIIAPTFNEYVARFGTGRVKLLRTGELGYRYGVKDVLSFLETVETLVIVNPDNPSGNYLSRPDVINIIEAARAANKRVVVDESFIDFAGDGLEFSLIDDEVLSTHTNLYVIKSISKSYGVPGVRLGVLASADREMLDRVSLQLPVWNINSFGEYFLQIIGRYKNEYRTACGRLAEERDWLFGELERIPEIRPLPSRANYLLAEVGPATDATAVTTALLEKYNILLKDCTGKSGFAGRSFVRISVRDRHDNEHLLRALRETLV